MKKLLSLVISLLLLLALLSCGAPPDDLKPVNVLDWIHSLLPKLNEINLNEEKQKTFVKEEIQSKKELIAFYKDYSINIHSKEEKKSDFMHSLDNSGFILKKPIYVTYEDNDMYISFDQNTWIPIKTMSPDTDFIMDYKFESKLNKPNKSIDIYFSNALTMKKELKNTIKLKQHKPVQWLDAEMTLLNNKDKSSLSIDLKKNILYIPANTILTGNFLVIGNIIETNSTKDTLTIKALRDIFVYINKTMLNLSLDGSTWGLGTILSLKFDSNVEIKSKEKNKIYFCITADINYKE